jgi:hypothetical protein
MAARKSDAEDSMLSASATVEALASVISEALEACAPDYRAFRKVTTEHEAEAVARAIIRKFQVAPRPRP